MLEEIKQLLLQLKQAIEDLPSQLKISTNQVVLNTLADLSTSLGLIQAGEFRVGNGKEPGHGFTGVRIAYPPMTYGGSEYPFVSVNNDVLQVGIGLSDGTLYAGEGQIRLDAKGMTIYAAEEAYNAGNAINFDYGGNLIADIWADSLFGLRIESDVPAGFYAGIDLYVIENSVEQSHIQMIDEIGMYAKGGIYMFDDFFIGSDITTGVGGFIGLTNVTAANTGSNAGTVEMGTGRANAGWHKIMVGTTPAYVPYWTDIS